MWLRCLTFSCHSAGIWRTRSRTESTRCTSASPSEASARSTWVGVARAKISWLMIAVPCHVAHLLGQPVPGADGLGLQAAPRQRHQVERGEEVRVEAVGRVEDVVLAQHASGCGRARPGGRTCRSWGSPRAAALACSSLHAPLHSSAPCASPGPRPSGSPGPAPAGPRRPRPVAAGGSVARREGGEVADDSVASAADSSRAMRAAEAATHSRSRAGTTTGAAPVSGIRRWRVRIRAGRSCAGTLRPTTAAMRRASSAWSAPGTRTSGRRRTPTWRGSRSRSVTIRTKGRRAFQRRTRRGEVGAGGQLVALAPEPQPLRPRRAAGLEAALGPGVGEQLVEGSADGDEERAAGPPSGRPRRGQVARASGRRGRGRRRGGSAAATAGPTRADRVGAEGDEVVGEQHARHPEQLVGADRGRVDRPRSEAGASMPTSGQVGLAAPGGRRGQHPVGESVRRRPARPARARG